MPTTSQPPAMVAEADDSQITSDKAILSSVSLGRYVVSVVMTKDIPNGKNTQNKLYAIKAVSSAEAHGKAIPLAQADYPQHQLHTICSFAIEDERPNDPDQRPGDDKPKTL